MGPKRNKEQQARDRAEIARLYLSGTLQVNIAAEIGVSQQQISYDLKIIRQQWLDSALRDFDEARSRELAKIDNLEITYWQAWQRVEGQTRVGPQLGDLRFLQGVQWCIDRRCKLLGLDAPDRMEFGGSVEMPIKIIEPVRPEEEDADG